MSTNNPLPSDPFGPSGDNHGAHQPATNGSTPPSAPNPTGARSGQARKKRKMLGIFDQLLIRTPRDYLLMFMERWHWGLLAAVPVAAAIVWMEFRKPEVFQTETAIIFETNPERVLNVQQVVDTTVREGVQFATHRETIRSATFFEYLMTFFTDEEIERIRAPYRESGDDARPPPSAAHIIRQGLYVNQRRNTMILQIGVRHRNPETAAFISERVARQYIEFIRDRAATGTSSAIQFLQSQERELRTRVEEAERELQEFRARHSISNIGDSISLAERRVQALYAAQVSAEMQVLEIRDQVRKVQSVLEEGGNLQDIPFIYNFRDILALESRLEELKTARDVLGRTYLERHPRMIENELAQESVQNRIRASIENAITNLRTRLDLARASLESISSELATAEKESMEIANSMGDFSFLERQITAARANYDNVVHRLNETRIASQLESANIKIFDRPWVPGSPVEPSVTKAAVQGLALAFVILFGLPLGIGILDTRLKAAWEVDDLFDYPLLGEIPRLKGIKKRDRPTLVLKGEKLAACEAYNGLYSQIEITAGQKQARIMMITSTVPHEGKSTIASNLAANFAIHGTRTLLLDLDLRRPAQHGYHTLDNEYGVLKWINEGAELDIPPMDNPHLGIVEMAENFFLLRSGGDSKRPTKHFTKPYFPALFKALQQHFDLIILDTPPIGVFPDGVLLSKLCHEVVYVCKFNAVSKPRLNLYLQKLESTGTPILGLVLNGVPTGRASGYYDYYGYGIEGEAKYAKYYAKAK